MLLLSKLLSPLTQPLAWVALLLLLVAWWIPRRPMAAQRVLLAGLVLGLLVGWQPLPDALLRRLESQFERPPGGLQQFVGLIVLGGAIEPLHVRRDGDRIAVTSGSERVALPIALMREYPDLRLLYVGRELGVKLPDGSETSAARLLFSQAQVGDNRVLHEQGSRNTFENAVLSAKLVGNAKSKRWLLVTSARHMPRSLAAFRSAGWNVTPYPVDYMTGSHTPWMSYSLARGALLWQAALYEYLGIFAYAAVRRI